MRELDIVEHVGRIGIDPRFPAAVIGVAAPRLARRRRPAADVRPGHRRQRAARSSASSSSSTRSPRTAATRSSSATCARSTCRTRWAGSASSPCSSRASAHAHAAAARRRAPRRPATRSARAADVLARTGIESADMYVAFVPEASSEWRAGLRPGDRITTLDGAPQRLWRTMEDELVAGADKRHELAVDARRRAHARASSSCARSSGTTSSASTTSATSSAPTTGCPTRPIASSPTRTRSSYALRRGHRGDAAASSSSSASACCASCRGASSLSSVSGPITMYDIAGQAGAQGHRRTSSGRWRSSRSTSGSSTSCPSRCSTAGTCSSSSSRPRGAGRCRCASARWRASSGMVVLVLLMLVAFKNDVERRWDVIVTQVRELVVVKPRTRRRRRDVAARVLVRVEQGATRSPPRRSRRSSRAPCSSTPRDRALATELVYGSAAGAPVARRARSRRFAPRGIDEARRARARAPRRSRRTSSSSRACRRSRRSTRRWRRCARARGRASRRSRTPCCARCARASAARQRRRRARGRRRSSTSTPAWLRDALERVARRRRARARSCDAASSRRRVGAARRATPRSATRGSSGCARPRRTRRSSRGACRPRAILARGAGKPQRLPGLGEGAWSVQEEGSQLAALALGARAGRDACSTPARGAGTRRRCSRARWGASGAVDACDASPAKLERLGEELARARARARAHATRWTGRVGLGRRRRARTTRPRRRAVHRRRHAAAPPRDRAAARAATTSSAARARPGARSLARAADARAPGRRARLRGVQRAARGGARTWSTRSRGAARARPAPFDAPEAALSRATDVLRLLPHVHGTDGYFVARLVRR